MRKKGKRALPAPAPWHLYIARCADDTLYTGIAKDVTKRLEAHNQGKGARYTRSHGPVVLLFQEPQADYSSALRREYQVKRLGRRGKEAFAAGKPLARPGEKSRMSFQKDRKKAARKPRKRRARKSLRKRPPVVE